MMATMNPPKPAFMASDRASTKSRSSLKDIGRKIMIPMGLLSRKGNRQPSVPSSSSSPAELSTSPKANTPKQAQPEQNTPAPMAKSKNIIRRVSMAFQKPAPPTGEVPPIPNISAKLKREAALRQVGLLANKDLSLQEQEQDHILCPPVQIQPDSDGDASAASRIKAEWEAKNGVAGEERSKMSTFKFGGLSSSPSLSNVAESVDEPSIGLSPSGARSTRPPPLKLHPATPVGSMSIPALAGPVPSDPTCIALPPSPGFSIQSIRCASPTLVPLPPSPSPSFIVVSDTNNDLLQPEYFSLPGSPRSVSHDTDDTCLPSRTRTRSQTLLSTSQESSDDCPSVYASSHTLTMETSESVSSLAKQKIAATKTWETSHAISVIAESPREEGTFNVGEEKAEVPERTTSPAPRAQPRRSKTDAAEKKNRNRRSLGLFLAGPPKSNTTLTAKVSVSSSMGNLRRSVVGTLSRKETKNSMPPSPRNFPPPSSPPPTSRLPISPRIHSRGSILIEASGIEDEESRRMTEMAFLN